MTGDGGSLGKTGTLPGLHRSQLLEKACAFHFIPQRKQGKEEDLRETSCLSALQHRLFVGLGVGP